MEPTANTPIQPERATFDPNEQLASVFLSNVTDFKTRLNLRAVSTAFLLAEKQNPSTPLDPRTTQTFGEFCEAAGNFKKSYEWFKKSVEQDEGQSARKAHSMFHLACCLQNGKGVEENPNEALKWCVRAAEAGSPDAMVSLGLTYSGGVKEDKAKMVMWLQRAIAQGDRPEALVFLADVYLNGDEVDKDVALGVEYIEKAVDQGHHMAQCRLGMMYINGSEGVG